jgi:anti-sigma factor RsiW
MNPMLPITEEELHAWLDGELPAEREAAVERHLAANPEERQRFDAYRADGEAIARIFSCAESEASVPAVETRPRRARWLWSAGPAIAAGILMGVIGLTSGMLIERTAPKSDYAEQIEEVAGYHLVYARETKHLVEIPASQREELVAWMSDRLGRRMVIPDLSGDGLTFGGGRMLVVNHRPVAQLLYTRAGGQPIGVCVTQLPDEQAPINVDHRDGLRLVSWVQDGYGYIIVGDLPETQVRQVADRVATSFGS